MTVSRKEWRWAVRWALVGVLLSCLPYLIVFQGTPPEQVYTGFLTNPEDGTSYLAKMRQGQRGEWLFTLPYTAEPHQGEWTFTYYLALGHTARWLGLCSPGALIWVWHAARAVNGGLLLLALYYGIAHWFHDRALRRFAYLLTALGGGLGWLATLFGLTTIDLWVPEGYVWYSMLANPHFPLAIALMLLIVTWSGAPWGDRRVRAWRLARVALSALLLGLVQPLGLLNVGAALVAYVVLLWLQHRRPPWREIASGLAVALTGGPFVLHAYLLTVRNPTMALWSAQNQTPSPPPWEVAIGYGLVLILAIIGLLAGVRRKRDSDWLLAAWMLTTAALLYAPFGLQRRLVIAWIVPLGMLATRGWDALRHHRQRWAHALRPGILCAFSALTPILLVSILVTGALTKPSALMLGRDEKAALDWLAVHAPPDALVLAGPETGRYIPAWAGQRVWYGHRFETAHADQRRAQVTAFYRDGDHSLLEQAPPLHTQYVWFGPREAALSGGNWQPDPAWTIAFSQGAVTLYALP